MDLHDLAYSLGLRNVKVDPTADTPGELADQIINAVRAVPHHPTGPRTEDADLCACCGNQFKPGQVCDSCRYTDPEVAAMAALAPVLPLVSALGHDARARVMDWATRRACDGLPPF